MYKRVQYDTLLARINEPRRFIQVVMGPRQVGKTTTVKQVLSQLPAENYLFYSADDVPASQSYWISDVWDIARTQLQVNGLSEILLVIDEIQKISRWSDAVKKEWDSDTFNDVNIKVVLLGSSRVLLQKGLAESLAGRFETIKFTHWSYKEMKEAFGLSLNQYIYFGGYPGAMSFIEDEQRWTSYVKDSIIESSINKDILMDSPIGKPALLRQTFELGAAYSGQILSLTKMLGQLQDAGNTTTLTGYLRLLNDSGLIGGLQKYANDLSRRRGSIPKFQVYNNALRNVYAEESYNEVVKNPKQWGRIVESAVGAYLLSNSFVLDYELFYWRVGNDEVDYIIKKNSKVVAIEVKSGNDMRNSGLSKFREAFNPLHSFIVGKDGISLDQFFLMDISKLFH